MFFIIIATLIFGMVHPGAKYLFNNNISTLSFCFLYIIIRLISTLPFIFFMRKNLNISTIKTNIRGLLLIGIVGASLQFLEFYGLNNGLPVSFVTFSISAQPIWLYLFCLIYPLIKNNLKRQNSENISKENDIHIEKHSFIFILTAMIGLFFVSYTHSSSSISFSFPDLFLYLSPILASGCIAAWIIQSSSLKRKNISSLALSFFYDFFALLTITFSIIITNQTKSSFHEISFFLNESKNFIDIIFYSIFIGLLPNILFYIGSKSCSPTKTGLVLLFEPIIATILSSYLFNETLTNLFYLGAILILIPNIPVSFFKNLASNKKAISFLIIFSLTSINIQSSYGKTFNFIEIYPAEKDEYIVNSEILEIKHSLSQGIKDYPFKCSYSINKNIYEGSSKLLLNQLKKTSQIKGKNIITGLSRSSFAKMGAKATKGTSTLLLSIGASTNKLSHYNPNTLSIASPWTTQWKSIEKKLQLNNCHRKNTHAIFSQVNSLLMRYLPIYRKNFSYYSFRGQKKILEIAKTKRCLYICLNFSNSQSILKYLINSKWQGVVVGTGDWNIFSHEIKTLLKKSPPHKKMKILSPTGWNITKKIKAHPFYRAHYKKFKREMSPIAAYTYDATKISLDYLCRDNHPRVFNKKKLKELHLMREYYEIEDSGNYRSSMHIINHN